VPSRSPDTTTPARGLISGALVRKLMRYAGGSAVATVCSELTLVVLYGFLHVTPVWASCLAWLGGAIPNYWLNRSWTWRLKGRPDLVREVLPYVGIVAVTLVLATAATRAVDAGLKAAATSSATRVALVAATFLAVYVAMFVLRFFLFDRLFTRLDESPAGGRPLLEPPVARPRGSR
jgi:putative flippase GtrA